MAEIKTKIPAEMEPAAVGGMVTDAKYIIDRVKNKNQTEINAATDASINQLSNEIDAVNTQDIVPVDSLPAVGSADPRKIYRVVGETSYTDNMVNAAGDGWKELAVYTFPGIDDEPTAGSENLVKSGGVFTTIDEIGFNIDGINAKAIGLTSGYINTSGSAGTVVDLTPVTHPTMGYAIINCAEGDVFYVEGRSGTLPRLYCFIDSENKIISNSTADLYQHTPLRIVAPENTAKLIINNSVWDLISYQGEKTITDVYNQIDTIDNKVGKSDINGNESYISTQSEVHNSRQKIIELAVNIKQGDTYSWSVGGTAVPTDVRIYRNQDGTGSSESKVGTAVAAYDITKLILWSNNTAIGDIDFSCEWVTEGYGLTKRVDNIESDTEELKVKVGKPTVTKTNSDSVTQSEIHNDRKRVIELTVDVKVGETLSWKVSGSGHPTDVRIYRDQDGTMLSSALEASITSNYDIAKLILWANNTAVGDIDFSYSSVAEGSGLEKRVQDLEGYNLDELDDSVFGIKFEETFDVSNTVFDKIGTVDLGKEYPVGTKIKLYIERTYTEGEYGGRVYYNAAPALATDISRKSFIEFITSQAVSKFVFYDECNGTGGQFKIQVVIKDALTDINVEQLTSILDANAEKIGVVMGDSHAQNRDMWVPDVYRRLGIKFDKSLTSTIIGSNANQCGTGYEWCLDPVYSQAFRLVEQYLNNNKKADYVLLDNVHYQGTVDPQGAFPFCPSHAVSLGSFDSAENEQAWFDANFASAIANVTPEVGGLTYTTWTGIKYVLIFSGTPVGGTTFTLIINGTSYATPVNNGDTLASLVQRIGQWVFDEQNWATSVSSNTLTLSYIGSGTAPTLTITYDAGGSGVTMTSESGSNTVSIYRYFESYSTSDWNDTTKWKRKVSGWSISSLKGAIELLYKNIPDITIVLISLPYWPLLESKYETPFGQDINAFMQGTEYSDSNLRKKAISDMAALFNLSYVDMEKDANISISNYFEYFAENDVHPNELGYKLLAKAVAVKLGY